MDLFFHCTDAPSRRVHFNEFMLDVHKRLHQLRDSGGDAMTQLTAQLLKQGWLLCFDEFQVCALRFVRDSFALLIRR